MSDQRPDPDRLLAAIERDTQQAARGHLKIFFGACAGVGKTYAMLAAAKARLADGGEVLIGLVETHRRADTAAMLADLLQLPRRKIAYRGRELEEFDLDAALAAKPALIVVDELAHTNVDGSRHRKRWQDVEELLAAGIDVWTALNVQHLESLNDVVGRITGIRVAETVPDRIFERADEVAVVDLPVAELQARITAGKVYLGESANRATDNFFRTGNLIALRELALRRTADRVDAQMQAWREDRAIKHVWQTRSRLIVCIGPKDDGEMLVRAAARMATRLQAEWIALTVETPAEAGADESSRTARATALKLATSLGAEVCTLDAADAAEAIVRFAVNRNADKLIVGHSRRFGWRRLWRPALLDQLIRHESVPEIVVVGLEPAAAHSRRNSRDMPFAWQGYVWAVAVCILTTVVAALLLSVFDLANVVMVFLLAVVAVSLRFGRGPGALAAFLAVFALDFFFVPPRFTLRVQDTQYLFTFLLMLGVALVLGQLAARLKFEALSSSRREHQSQQQAELSRVLSAALTTEQIVELALPRLTGLFNAQVQMLLPDAQEHLHAVAGAHDAFADQAVAEWVFAHQQSAGLGTATLPAARARYLPLRASMRVRGVIGVRPLPGCDLDAPEMQRQIDLCLAQVAQALERVHYVEVAQEALVSMESERLRNSLLAAVSHDLRTPLTGLIGMADMLAARPGHGVEETAMIEGMRETAHRLVAQVTNLLDMARLQTGHVELRLEWCAIDESIETATRALAAPLATHTLVLDVAADVPLVRFDAVLIERVLVNLLDNACKYTAPASQLRIRVRRTDGNLEVAVEDDGPGLPAGDTERLFEKFERGHSETTQGGVGLGLAICRAIVHAHGGEIHAYNLPGGGAAFRFTLPATELPPEEDTLESV